MGMASPNLHETLAFFVDRLRAHSALDEHDRQALMSLPARELSLSAHQPLARSGQASSYAWLVSDGLVGRVAQTDDGLRQIQELFVPGDIADLGTMMMPTRRCAIEAITRSRMVGVPHAALRELSDARPAIALAFSREILRSQDILLQWMLNVGRRDARARVIHLICEMAVRYRVVSHGGQAEFHLPMTQEQLGDVLALTPVHINRTLKTLREDGLVTMVRQRVTIHDWPTMARAGEFDPSYLRAEGVGEAAQARPSRLASI
jgi:CRP-like cAMP-binding protein